jgi:hypothetical protein
VYWARDEVTYQAGRGNWPDSYSMAGARPLAEMGRGGGGTVGRLNADRGGEWREKGLGRASDDSHRIE